MSCVIKPANQKVQASIDSYNNEKSNLIKEAGDSKDVFISFLAKIENGLECAQEFYELLGNLLNYIGMKKYLDDAKNYVVEKLGFDSYYVKTVIVYTIRNLIFVYKAYQHVAKFINFLINVYDLYKKNGNFVYLLKNSNELIQLYNSYYERN